MKFKINQIVPLLLQLTDEDNGLYPQAILRDDTGTQIGLPLDLANVGNGLYKNTTFQMPSTSYITAQYKVYQDALHSIKSYRHPDTIKEVFYRDFAGEAIDSILSSINTLLAGGFKGDLEGFVLDAGQLLGIIEDSENISALLEDSGNIVGFVEEDELIGMLASDESITGYISC